MSRGLDKMSFLSDVEQPTPSAARPCSPSRDPNIGQNDKSGDSLFTVLILSLIFGTAKPLIEQEREGVSKI